MTKTNRFNVLRLRYEAALEAAKTIAIRNANLLRKGRALTDRDRSEEIRAAEELQLAFDQLTGSSASLH